LLVGLDAVIFERGEQKLAHLHGVIAASAPDADMPDRPVAEPQYKDGGQQPEESVAEVSLPFAE
jgi:hypothetical protein